MNADQTLTHMRNLGKVRASKHYDANKEAINAKRRAKYAEKHGLAPKPAVVIPVVIPENVVISAPVIVKKGKKIIIKKPVAPTQEILTLAIVQQKIKDLNIEKSSETKYLGDIKRVMKMTGCDDLNECLKQHKKIIDLVNNSKMRNGEPYAENTKKSAFQSILFVIDNLKLNIDKKLYLEQFEIKKIISMEQNEDKIANEEVPTFEEYLQGCKANFTVGSKESLIAKFYDELTVRDDYGLVITDKNLENKNYLLIKPTSIEIVINNYKTDKKYGIIRHKLTKALEKITRAYITKNGLKIGDYLFGTEHLSSFVSKMNKTLGYKSGVGLFRHMKITEQLGMATPAERVKLAEVMKHSPVVQKAYLRKMKLI